MKSSIYGTRGYSDINLHYAIVFNIGYFILCLPHRHLSAHILMGKQIGRSGEHTHKKRFLLFFEKRSGERRARPFQGAIPSSTERTCFRLVNTHRWCCCCRHRSRSGDASASAAHCAFRQRSAPYSHNGAPQRWRSGGCTA